MSALDTAIRVLDWALEPEIPPPMGSLTHLETLLKPTPAAQAALGRLAASTAALVGLRTPPLGDATAPGGGAFLLAAAIGAAQHPAAAELLRCADSPRSAWDWVVRHGLAQAALAHMPPVLAERLHAASPLTALLLAPLPGEENQAVQLAEHCLAHADGRRLLIHHCCDPNASSKCLVWRGLLLGRLGLVSEFQPTVLDVYETAVALHRQPWLELTQESWAALGGPTPSAERLELITAVAAWWEPLRALHRAHLDWLRERTYLDFNLYLQGIKLAQVAAQWGNAR